jgi:sulfopyruvate decarboxylase alpha subunit
MLTGDRSAAATPPSDPYQPAAVLAWQQELASVLIACGTDTAVVVPDSRLDGILSSLARAGVLVRQLTREEECVAFAAGHRVSGRQPVLFMQCSGLGNAANALGSLAIPYGLSVPLVISMRGTLGERNPAQIAMGRATVPLLTSLGIQVFPVRSETEVEPITRGALALCFEGGCPAAILLEPELGGGRDERG